MEINFTSSRLYGTFDKIYSYIFITNKKKYLCSIKKNMYMVLNKSMNRYLSVNLPEENKNNICYDTINKNL